LIGAKNVPIKAVEKNNSYIFISGTLFPKALQFRDNQTKVQINHQPDATIFRFIILTFIYSSTCFGRFPAHHQELNDRSGSPWFYLCAVFVVGPTRPDHKHSTAITTIRR
jgi:hypothetical protein